MPRRRKRRPRLPRGKSRQSDSHLNQRVEANGSNGFFPCVCALKIISPLTFDKKKEMLLSNVEGKMAPATDLLQGTLDMLILKTLAPGQEHGWAIAQRIQEMSNNVLQIGQGSLYPALHRLEYRGWIRATWGASENNRRARFYALTAAGRRQLDAELENWDRLTGAVNLVLQGA